MILNEVMGWSGYHMFEFCHQEMRIIENAEDFKNTSYDVYNYLNAETTYVREYLEENGWFTYTYDMGDYWEYQVTIEKVIEDYEYDYPMVLKYKGACPPEDCGGIWSYYDCFNIINDETHPEYKDRLAWLDMQGYTGEYDMQEVNRVLKEQFFYRWGKGESRAQGQIYEEYFAGTYELNAVKKDKNTNSPIIRSDKYKMEDNLETIADLFRKMGSLLFQLMWRKYITNLKGKNLQSNAGKQAICMRV